MEKKMPTSSDLVNKIKEEDPILAVKVDTALKDQFHYLHERSNITDEEMLRGIASGACGERPKEILLNMALKPRKYNSSTINNHA